MLEIIRQFEKLQIMKLNDELGESLGIKKIEVNADSHSHLVDVWIDVMFPSGSVKKMPLSQYRSLKAIGLSLKTYQGASL